MAQHLTKPVLDKVDPVWARIRREAEDVVRREPEFATFIYSTILHHDSLEGGIVYRLAARLDHAHIVQIYDFGVDGDTYYMAMEHVAGAER